MSNFNPSDEAAHRLFEQQYFQPGAIYGSRADFYRDQRTERYRKDESFRALVDAKLEFSMQNNPTFDRPVNPATDSRPMSVIASRGDKGDMSFEVSADPGFHSRPTGSTSDTETPDKYDENGVKIEMTAFGLARASLRIDGSAAKAKPEESGKPFVRIKPLS